MSTYTSISNANKKTSTFLTTDYIQSFFRNSSSSYFHLERRVQKSYSFIGLTEAAANAVAALKRAKFVRNVNQWNDVDGVWVPTPVPTSCADVRVNQDGPLFSVSVDVSESDSVYRSTLAINPPNNFELVNSFRSYDELNDGGHLELTGSYVWDTVPTETARGVTLPFALHDVTPSSCVLQYYNPLNSSPAWNDVSGLYTVTFDFDVNTVYTTCAPIKTTNVTQVFWYRVSHTFTSGGTTYRRYSDPKCVIGVPLSSDTNPND